MLTSLILQLQTPTDARLPANLGRASQAAFLRLLGQREAALARALHERDGPKPFTASNLMMGRREQGSLNLKAGETGWLRFTGLTKPVSEHLLALAGNPPPTIELDGHPLTVTGTTLEAEDHSWAGQIGYQALAAPYLLGGTERRSRYISLDFASPTTFRSQGNYVPLPLPELVFGSLLNRWQAFAPIALSPEIQRFAAESVLLSRFRLRSRGMPYKQGGIHVGFTGQATFIVSNQDRYWLNMLHLLAAFAFYSGVGYQTTAGLGQVRPGKPVGPVVQA